jgi:hypothetical protein
MEYRLACECGQQISFSEGAAGNTLQCACGRSVTVPSLGELKKHWTVDTEAAVAAKTRLSAAQLALLTIGGIVFGSLILLRFYEVTSRAGEVAGCGFFIAEIGEIWLLVLIVRECHPDAIFYALMIPFFTWYFAYQRWDIAKRAFACSLSGTLLFWLGLYIGI